MKKYLSLVLCLVLLLAAIPFGITATAGSPNQNQLMIGTQTKSSETRLIVKLTDDAKSIEDYDAVGIALTVDGQLNLIDVDSVYDSFYNSGSLVTAEQLGCTYVAILEIGNISAAKSVTAQGYYTVGGTTLYGNKKVLRSDASTNSGIVSVKEVQVGAKSVTVCCGATGAKDWFHIFPKGYTSSAQNLGNYKYCSANSDVVYNLTNPITAGEYVVVMYLNDGYTVGSTYEFVVGDKVEYPYIDKESYYSGESINILWDNVPAEYGWVGVYAKGYTTYSNYGDYTERGKGTSLPSGDTKRYKSLSWPLDPGEYSAVFFVGSTYTVGKTVDFTVMENIRAAVSNVAVGDTSVTVHCGVNGSKDWFHIFPKGYKSSSEALGNFKYLKSNEDVVYNLTNPITAGDYVIVVYLNDSYTVGATYEFTVSE